MTTPPTATDKAGALGYLVEFHPSNDVKAMDPDNLGIDRVGPFRFAEEADDFGEDHLRFYDRYEVVGLLEGVLSPQEWIAMEEDDPEEEDEIVDENSVGKTPGDTSWYRDRQPGDEGY